MANEDNYKSLILPDALYGEECINFVFKKRIGKAERKILR